MLEIVIYSLFIGSLGLEALFTSNWLSKRHISVAKQNQVEEEERILNQHEAQESFASQQQLQVNGSPNKAYSTDPRSVDWEFKIVRASGDLFRDPAVLGKLCGEEKQAGWLLLEKLDDRRIRFKRSGAYRDLKPKDIGFDPYRTHYGPRITPAKWIAAIALGASVIVPAYVGYTIMSDIIASQRRPSIDAPAPGQSPLRRSPQRTVEDGPQSDGSLVTGGSGRPGSISPTLY